MKKEKKPKVKLNVITLKPKEIKKEVTNSKVIRSSFGIVLGVGGQRLGTLLPGTPI